MNGGRVKGFQAPPVNIMVVFTLYNNAIQLRQSSVEFTGLFKLCYLEFKTLRDEVACLRSNWARRRIKHLTTVYASDMILFFTDSITNGFWQEHALSMLANTGKDCSDITEAGSLNYSRAPDKLHCITWGMIHKTILKIFQCSFMFHIFILMIVLFFPFIKHRFFSHTILSEHSLYPSQFLPISSYIWIYTLSVTH